MEQEWTIHETQHLALGDGRRVNTFRRVLTRVEQNPEQSLSTALGGVRQAAHDLFEHPDVTPARLLAGHVAATAARCADHPVVLVAQDTTAFVYSQKQLVGLRAVNELAGVRTLLGHSAFALTPEGLPLGVAQLEFRGADPAGLPPPGERDPDQRESRRWRDTVTAIVAVMPPTTQVFVIADREADLYTLFTTPRRPQVELLIRAAQDRTVAWDADGDGDGDGEAATDCRTERGRLFAVAASAPVLGTHTVAVPARPATRGQAAQPGRTATLEVRATWVRLQRPPCRAPDKARAAAHPQPAAVGVTVLQARELDPPAGVAALCWVLLCTVAVTDLAEAQRLLCYYARRWVIERLHYVLKSGLKAERLQIDDARSLSHCLTAYYLVAWRLLPLTYLGRLAPGALATEILAWDEIAVLEARSGVEVVTVGAAIREIARLGGYAPYRNGPPAGVKSLWIGLQLLRALAEGWRLGRAAAAASRNDTR